MAVDGGSATDRPPYNAHLIRAVGSLAQIASIELVGSFFSKQDDLPLPSPEPALKAPQVSSRCFWDWNPDDRLLGAILRCEARFSQATSDDDRSELSDRPYFVGADFRAVYQLQMPEADDPDDDALATFAYWNGLLNVWPYWREYVGNVLQRARIEALPIPLFKFPVPEEETARRAEAAKQPSTAEGLKQATGTGGPASNPGPKRSAASRRATGRAPSPPKQAASRRGSAAKPE
jgi:hypothetical protein